MIKVMIDTCSFKNKPSGPQAGGVQNRLGESKLKEVNSLLDVKTAVENGKTLRCGVLKEGSKSSDDFIYGQLLLIDVDTYEYNGLEQTIQRCKDLELTPFIVYKSFSYELKDMKKTIGAGKNRRDNPHYKDTKYNHRVGFMLDNLVKDVDIFLSYINTLIYMFDGDTSCIDSGRLMFGTKHIATLFEETARISPTKLEELQKQIKVKKSEEIQSETVPKASGEATKRAQSEPSKKCPLSLLYSNTRAKIRDTFYKRLKSVDLTGIGARIDGQNFTFRNTKDFSDSMKLLDLSHLFNEDISKSIRCIFHDDKNESARFTFNENAYYYRCFSNSCELSTNPLDIFNIISYLETGRVDEYAIAFKTLMTITNSQINESQWYKAHSDIIKSGRAFIKTLITKQEENKTTRRAFNKSVKQLYSVLLNEAEMTLDKAKDDSEERELAFSISHSFLAKLTDAPKILNKKTGEIKEDTKLVRNGIHRLVMLGFIEILSDEEVNQEYSDISKRVYKLKDKYSENSKSYKTINTYRIKRIDTDMLNKSDKLLTEYKKKGIVMSSYSNASDNVGDIKFNVKTKVKLTASQKKGYLPLKKYYYDKLRNKKYVVKKEFKEKSKLLGISENISNTLFIVISNELQAVKVSKKYLEEKKIKTSKDLSPNSTLFSNI